MTIAISGASGQLGRIAIESLKTRVDAKQIVALARDTARVADLGVAARTFDYTRPETMAAALDGVEVLALISSSDFENRVGQHENVITAAKAAGVGRVIYTSILKADQSPLMIAQDHKATEEILKASGLSYTMLRNPWYIENWTASLPIAVAQGAMIGATGGAKCGSSLLASCSSPRSSCPDHTFARNAQVERTNALALGPRNREVEGQQDPTCATICFHRN